MDSIDFHWMDQYMLLNYPFKQTRVRMYKFGTQYSVLVADTQVTVCVLHETAGISECVHVAAHVCVWKNGLWYM